MQIKTNIGQISKAVAERLKQLQDKEYFLRPVCFGLIDKMTQRIHIDGKGSDNAPIGNYSSDYLRRRQNKPYNRTGDTKIIVSLTRQLENDWSVIATQKGYAIGFLNEFNLQKARWVEGNKGKKIFSLTEDEQKYAVDYLNELTADAIA